jgi:ParB family chromosome partitioning protein
MSELTRVEQGELEIYEPEKGLKTIAVSEAAEKHWRRAKDATKLQDAIKAKLLAQAEYVVWRDRAVVPSRESGGRVLERGPGLPEGDPGKRTIHRWRKRLCTDGKPDDKKIKRATIVDTDKLARVLEDVGMRCQRVTELENANTIRGTEGTGEFERYTPAEYIEAVREVLGEIDLDPATSAMAQETVRANNYFTEKDDGLMQEWHGRVFLNPPYHRELAPKFIDKLVREIVAGRATEAILLTNNCTDTDWFDAALRGAASVCFSHGRIRFYVPRGEEVLPTQGQAFFYYGNNPDKFEDVFCTIGPCLRPSKHYRRDTDADRASMGMGGSGDESTSKEISQ